MAAILLCVPRQIADIHLARFEINFRMLLPSSYFIMLTFSFAKLFQIAVSFVICSLCHTSSLSSMLLVLFRQRLYHKKDQLTDRGHLKLGSVLRRYTWVEESHAASLTHSVQAKGLISSSLCLRSYSVEFYAFVWSRRFELHWGGRCIPCHMKQSGA